MKVFSMLRNKWMLQIFGVLLLGVIFAGGYGAVQPVKAAAAECGVHTGRMSSLAGLIVEVNWVPYGSSSRQATGSGITVRVWASDSRGDSDRGGNIIQMDRSWNGYSGYGTSETITSNDLQFRQYSSGCGDGYNVVLGYGQGSTDTSYNRSPWALDCDESQFGDGNGRLFSARGYGTPSGARSGGTWTTSVIRSNNGFTITTSTTYYEPAPPNWALSGSTSRNISSVYPGQPVTFTSSILRDSQGGTASFQYGPRYFYSSTNSPTRTADQPYAGESSGGVANRSATLGPNGSLSVAPQTITVPTSASANYICGVVAFSPYNNSGSLNGRSSPSCIFIQKPEISCNALTSPATVAEPGFAFNLAATITGSSTAQMNLFLSGNPTFYMRYVNNATSVVTNVTFTRSQSGSTYTLTANPNITLVDAGLYTAEWGVTSSTVTLGAGSDVQSPGCSAGFKVENKPYFTTTGGDIYSQGSITSWNTNGGTYDGAGSQLAALATGNITSFITGSGVSGGVGTGSKLAFANTTKVGTKYGGGYAVSTATPPSMTTTSPLGTGAPDLNTLASGTYRISGTLTLSASSIPAGRNITIFVTSGNLFIRGNINYGAYALGSIPRLTVIVQNGNIYVDNDVNIVHGVFYSSGDFYSCATANNTPVNLNTTANAFNLCNRQLTVYGTVVANQLILSRTYGTVHGSGVLALPAENFIYSPEVWLAPSANTSGINGSDWDSYVSLPPIL